MEKSLDLRVQKTYNALVRALQELLSEKSYDQITVTELCDRAQTRKATFYKHFGDKNELFVYMIQKLQDTFHEENKVTYDRTQPQTYYVGVFRFFLDFVEQNEATVQRVLQSSAKTTLLDILAEQTEADILVHLQENQAQGITLPADPEFLASLYTGAILYGSSWWIARKNRPSKKQTVAEFAAATIPFALNHDLC